MDSRGTQPRLFPLGFFQPASDLTGANDCGGESGRLRDETTNFLLKSASALPRRFRFVSTVTILQQPLVGAKNHRGDQMRADKHPRCIGQSQRATIPKNSVCDRAEQLGIPWRFFPTYAQIQTGSVLSKQPFAT
jgi:hypothetical protein